MTRTVNAAWSTVAVDDTATQQTLKSALRQGGWGTRPLDQPEVPNAAFTVDCCRSPKRVLLACTASNARGMFSGMLHQRQHTICAILSQ